MTTSTTCRTSASIRWATGMRCRTCCATVCCGGLLAERPQLQYLMMHNIDTVGAHLDPGLLGLHISSGAAMTAEVIDRRLEDRGGGLARIDGKVRLVEGLALPREEIEFRLTYYNTNTFWIHIDYLLETLGLARADLGDGGVVAEALGRMAARMPTYVTLKEVKKRWGRGQEDIFPVTQFEKLWGDMTALPEMDCRIRCCAARAGSATQGGGPVGRLAAGRLRGLRGKAM